MQKLITIDNIDYTLFFMKNNENPELFILDSRTYNSGLDYFLGSDISTVYVYLVKKENVPVFIQEINTFISKAEHFNIAKEEDLNYLETLNDITFLHKVLNNSQYDFFISDFDMCMCREESYIYLDEHDNFIKKLEKLSNFSLYAGANMNDDNIFDFSIAYLSKKYKKELKKIYTSHGYQLDTQDISRFSDFHIVNNTKNKDIYLSFIKIYFSNIPDSIHKKDEFDKEIEKLISEA